MKSSSALNIGIAAMVFGLLAGCGQAGPLYLPKPPAKPAVPAGSAIPASSAIPAAAVTPLPALPPPPATPAAQ